MRLLFLAFLVFGSTEKMMKVPSGNFASFFKDPKTKKSSVQKVNAFLIDIYPVTNKEFYVFTEGHRAWQAKNTPVVFADRGYLKHWEGGKPKTEQEEWPAVNVSWFAAEAYCESQGKRLAKISEWESAAFDTKLTQKILDWYASPNKLRPVGKSQPNNFGIYDLHGLIWEWVEDFNSVMMPGRGDTQMEKFYCGSGALGIADPTNYAAFLRYGFRSSLNASYTVENLGFRCVKDI